MKLFPKQPMYQYGIVRNNTHSRRNKKTGKVEFILWKSGQQGHTEDYWHIYGDGWAETFETYKKEETK